MFLGRVLNSHTRTAKQEPVACIAWLKKPLDVHSLLVLGACRTLSGLYERLRCEKQVTHRANEEGHPILVDRRTRGRLTIALHTSPMQMHCHAWPLTTFCHWQTLWGPEWGSNQCSQALGVFQTVHICREERRCAGHACTQSSGTVPWQPSLQWTWWFPGYLLQHSKAIPVE